MTAALAPRFRSLSGTPTPFQAQNAEIARQWRALAISHERWERSENQAGAFTGEANGYMVRLPSLDRDRRAYLKPVTPHEIRRAAREKIASDLAHDLGLPVPPVLLVNRKAETEGEETAACVSLVLYPSQHSWSYAKFAMQQLRKHLPLDEMFSRASRMLPFDAWLGELEHKHSQHNIVAGYESDARSASFVFLDYSFAFGFRSCWEGSGWTKMDPQGLPSQMQQRIDAQAVQESLDLILRLSEDSIRGIIERIPDSHLAKEKGQRILHALLGRRELLAGSVEKLLEGRS